MTKQELIAACHAYFNPPYEFVEVMDADGNTKKADLSKLVFITVAHAERAMKDPELRRFIVQPLS